MDIASRQRPDVGLLDMEMPEVSGEALARALRTMFPDKAPLLIALSGNTALLELACSNGIFDQSVCKPIDIPSLMRLVGKRLAGTESDPSKAT